MKTKQKLTNWMTQSVLLLLASVFVFTLPFIGIEGSLQPAQASRQAVTADQQNRLCLTMIVKNESRIIERCLDSVKDIVDCVSICDTGSTDNTVAIIEDYLRRHSIPGKVHHHEWKNFGHNRTLSAQAAQKTLQELGFSLPHTYLLLLDADMVLSPKADFNKRDLKADSYLILQENMWIAYYNTRLIRASLPWECVGVTHEYWASKVPSQNANLETLAIDDREDGGCKSDKFERDIRLLTQGLVDEPDNVRYMFYLAQSYRCIKQYDDAINWYKTRIDKGGWKEEVFYSKLMIGEMYEEMGSWDQALHWYLDAYEQTPERAEPLQRIATHYRNNGQNQLAYLFAKQGSRIPYPKDHLLFVSYPAYDYQFDEELSISAFYTPFKEEGKAAANRLILNLKAPEQSKMNAYQNMLYYVENLKISEIKPIDIELPPLKEGSDLSYNPMNPSIQKTDDGYNLICRTVNWTQTKGKNYHSRDPDDPTIRTKNFLVRYDPSFNLLSQQEIIEDLPRQRHASHILGLEDCRLVESNGHHWIFSTTYDTHPGTVGQSLCKMKNSSDHTSPLIVENLVPLKGPDPSRCEKNWLPFVKDGELFAIYGYHPLTILKIDRTSGNCDIVQQKELTHDFSKFRGSASPIAFDDGYLALVHEVVFTDERTYLHRFIFLDKNLNITKVSKPFTFFHKGIEYSCGMTLNHDEKQCVIAIGFEDKQAFLGFVDLNQIRSLLEPLPAKK